MLSFKIKTHIDRSETLAWGASLLKKTLFKKSISMPSYQCSRFSSSESGPPCCHTGLKNSSWSDYLCSDIYVKPLFLAFSEMYHKAFVSYFERNVSGKPLLYLISRDWEIILRMFKPSRNVVSLESLHLVLDESLQLYWHCP